MTPHPRTLDYLTSCIATQRAYETLETLCEEIGPRQAGSHAEREACRMAAEVFAKSEYGAAVVPFTYPGWQPGESEVEAITSARRRQIPSNPLGWCPGARVEGSLVDAGMGGEKDLEAADIRGRVALVSSANPPGGPALHRSDKYRLAVEAGALAFLFYDTRRGGLVPMGSVDVEGHLGSIPALGVCYEDAAALRRSPEGTRIRIATSSGGVETTSHNTVALKEGRTEEEIVVCAHIDSWNCPGAFDNGSGTAAVIEIARLLEPLDLHRSVRFVLFGSEEVGLLGSRKYVEDLQDIEKVHTVVNLDCVAVRDGTVSIATNGSSELASDLTDIAQALRLEAKVHTGTVKHSDHYPFLESGSRGIFAASSGSTYSYAHTACDTLDKVTPESFTLPLLLIGSAVVEWAMAEDPGAPTRQP